jgi:hypothetical protein
VLLLEFASVASGWPSVDLVVLSLVAVAIYFIVSLLCVIICAMRSTGANEVPHIPLL